MNWITKNNDFLYDVKGIKELLKLSDKELAILVIMLKNPRHYNPLRNKERLAIKTNILVQILLDK